MQLYRAASLASRQAIAAHLSPVSPRKTLNYSTTATPLDPTNAVSGVDQNTDVANHAEQREHHAEPAGNEHKKTLAEMDEELRMKMSGIAGDGGEAGVEMEDGEPVAMKRSVKANMFRYI